MISSKYWRNIVIALADVQHVLPYLYCGMWLQDAVSKLPVSVEQMAVQNVQLQQVCFFHIDTRSGFQGLKAAWNINFAVAATCKYTCEPCCHCGWVMWHPVVRLSGSQRSQIKNRSIICTLFRIKCSKQYSIYSKNIDWKTKKTTTVHKDTQIHKNLKYYTRSMP